MSSPASLPQLLIVAVPEPDTCGLCLRHGSILMFVLPTKPVAPTVPICRSCAPRFLRACLLGEPLRAAAAPKENQQ
jgi:hypothetical protein